jgi:hypothetical protein
MSKLFRGDWVSRLIQIVTGASAAIGGVWVVIDQLGLLHGDILTWHPEYFEIKPGVSSPQRGVPDFFFARTRRALGV